MSSSTGASSTPTVRDDARGGALWKFVTKLEKLPGKGGNFKWRCNFCSVTKNGSYTRVKAHLLKIAHQVIGPCLSVTNKDTLLFKKLLEEKEQK
ncbi:hypothetical protein RHGRI_030654 [Rhododendron griersonianum]|uniref:BED-type domain-containing protein n=1 Tax=Rhododendron griersonianum TaxID=479676 RepID=A0AAV6I832_9ERIC|nr:hypothetical protein RHGRI_030654 [Rhododendron griersonianum]